MRKKFKNIIAFFLLITGLVMFSHSIIPHDHHYNIIGNLSNYEHHNNEKSDNNPIHCHFFNDIVIDKIISNTNQNLFKYLTSNIKILLNTKLYFDNNPLTKTAFLNINNLPDYFVLIESSPTRGSPFFC